MGRFNINKIDFIVNIMQTSTILMANLDLEIFLLTDDVRAIHNLAWELGLVEEGEWGNE